MLILKWELPFTELLNSQYVYLKNFDRDHYKNLMSKYVDHVLSTNNLEIYTKQILLICEYSKQEITNVQHINSSF
jgi:hypothetical protein